MLPLLFCASFSEKWDRAIYQDDTCSYAAQLNINNVYFENLNAYSQNGGAISIRGCSGTLTMNIVTFINCFSESTGGAIFLESNPYNVDATKICVSKCASTQNCQYAQFTSSQGTFTHTLTSVSSCSNDQGATVFQTKSYKTPSISNWNISQSRTMKQFSYMMENSPTIQYLNFHACPCYNGFTIGAALQLNYANFVDNHIYNRYFMYLSGRSAFQYCFFKNNNGYIKFSQSLTITDSYFDNFQVDGPDLSLTRVQTSGEVFPTNFEIYSNANCVAVPYVGEQPAAPEIPPATPPPTRSAAPTQWPMPTATPVPPASTTPDKIFEYQIYSSQQTVTSQCRVIVHDCVFNKIVQGINISGNNLYIRLEMWETTFYKCTNSYGNDMNSAGFLFDPKYGSSSDFVSCLVNRTCGYELSSHHSIFAYVKVTSNSYNHANLTSITRCAPDPGFDPNDGRYNTVDFRSGKRVFNSWNSSHCQVKDTAGIFTVGDGQTSPTKAQILYATFFNNTASRYMVLNCLNTEIIYSHLNIIKDNSKEGALFLAVSSTFLLESSIVLDCQIKDNKLMSFQSIGSSSSYSSSKAVIQSCYLQSNIDTSSCTVYDSVYASTETYKLTHFANFICEVEVSAKPLAPQPTFMTRCMRFDISEENKRFIKMKKTQVGMAFAEATLSV